MSPILSFLRHLGPKLLASVLALVMLLGAAAPALATGIAEIADFNPKTWVLDQGELLSFSTESSIGSALAQLAKDTGSQVRFVTIRRFDYGDDAESLATKIFDKWYPGEGAQDNQVLLLLDGQTNTTAIRVGEKAQDNLSESVANSVAQETVLVPLKEGNKYNEAMASASERLVTVLSGNPDPGFKAYVDNIQVESTFASRQDTQESNATVWVVVILLAATVIPMVTYYWYVKD
jgi:uncharacterized protein